MYLSRIKLDLKKRETLRALAFPNVMHGIVERSYRGLQERRMWRIDCLDDVHYVLILSAQKPHLQNFVNQVGCPQEVMPYEIKNYSPLLDSMRDGQRWLFRLCANPVRSSSKDKNNREDRGKIFSHVTIEQQRKWLSDRSCRNGFTLEDTSFDVIQTEWKRFRKGASGHEVSFRKTTYEGLLTISDVEKFKQILISGLGKAKAYGCGLMTVARWRGYPV